VWKIIVTFKANKKNKMATKKANTSRMKMISTEAKKLYNDGKGGMKWTSAIKKASDNLKKQGKL